MSVMRNFWKTDVVRNWGRPNPAAPASKASPPNGEDTSPDQSMEPSTATALLEPGDEQEAGAEYDAPVEEKQPTLRYGDDTVDGWVEYLQDLLNRRLKPNPNLPI